jgi:hypothetical protein
LEIAQLLARPCAGIPEGDRVVTCTYWIDERVRSVRCDMIATLSRPIT